MLSQGPSRWGPAGQQGPVQASLQVLAVVDNPVQGCASALPCSKPAQTANKPRWNCHLTWELVTEERHFTDSFICPINHFNGLSAITIFPRVGRAGVPTISRIEEPWMAIIINAHNKNMPGSRTPRAPLHPLVYGLAAPAPGQPRGGQEQQFTWQHGEHQRKAVQNHHLLTDLFYCVVKDST